MVHASDAHAIPASYPLLLEGTVSIHVPPASCIRNACGRDSELNEICGEAHSQAHQQVQIAWQRRRKQTAFERKQSR